MSFYKSIYCLLVSTILLCSCKDENTEVPVALGPTMGKCLVTAIKLPRLGNFMGNSYDSVAFKYTTANKLSDIMYYELGYFIPYKHRSTFIYNTDGSLSKIEMYDNFGVGGSGVGDLIYSYTMTLNEKKQVVKAIVYGRPKEPIQRRYITQRSFEYDSKGRLFKIDTDSSSAGAFEGGYLYRRFEYDNNNNVTNVYRKESINAGTMVELIERSKNQPEVLILKNSKFDNMASPFRAIKETINIHDILTHSTSDLSENNVLTATSYSGQISKIENRVYI